MKNNNDMNTKRRDHAIIIFILCSLSEWSYICNSYFILHSPYYRTERKLRLNATTSLVTVTSPKWLELCCNHTQSEEIESKEDRYG